MIRVAFTPDAKEPIRALKTVPGCRVEGQVAIFEEGSLLELRHEPGWLSLLTVPGSPAHVYRFPSTAVEYVDEERAARVPIGR